MNRAKKKAEVHRRKLEQAMEELREVAKVCGFDTEVPTRFNSLLVGHDENKLVVINVHVGRLICTAFRDFLESLKFLGLTVSWYEGKGIISRNFTIKTTIDVARKIAKFTEEIGGVK